jgi:prephenate dehydrogenase
LLIVRIVRVLTVPRTVAVLGLGLIGGSLLRRLECVGYDHDPATRAAARAAGFAVRDRVSDAVADADLVVVAVPLPALPDLLTEVGAHARPGTLLTDVTSVKGPVAAWVRGPVRYVGGHPMAGTERSGFAAADPALFEDAAWVLCLEPDTDLAGWLELAGLLTGIGARVVPTTASQHDSAVARISHLPHILAATMTAMAADPLARALAAGSFRDGTRVAGTRPELSTAMCQGNQSALDQALGEAIERLTQARSALRSGELEPFFRAAYELRRTWPVTEAEPVELEANRDDLLALGAAGGWITTVTENVVHGRRPKR